MNILFLTLGRITNLSERGIYTDLIREFVRQGHNMYIVVPMERRFHKPTTVFESLGAKILQVKTLNIQKTNIAEKGLGTLLLEYQYQRAISHYWKNIKFDLVLYSTPPITFNKVIASVKRRYGAKSYLLLKDIFPQNAVDLGLFSEHSLFYKVFRSKEKRLYELSDYIGCMSPANVDYVLKHNPEVSKEKVEVCPNSIELQSAGSECGTSRESFLKKWNIPTDKTLFVYGGNLGLPQGIDFLMKVVSENEKLLNSYLIIVGSGTEYPRLKELFDKTKPVNSLLLNALPKSEYDDLVKVCDVGLIFLDNRFTIPNYPSRILSYMENKMPVLMAIDKNTDMGTIAEKNKYGSWVEHGDLIKFMHLMSDFTQSENKNKKMGLAGYDFLKGNYTVNQAYKIIMNHFI